MIAADVLCEQCRYRLADGDLDGHPLCVHCVEAVLERWVAVDADPYLENLLPELGEGPFDR